LVSSQGRPIALVHAPMTGQVRQPPAGRTICSAPPLTLRHLHCLGVPKNSMKSLSSAERPILAWVARAPFGLGMGMATEAAPGMGCTSAVVSALGMYRSSPALPTMRLGPGAVSMHRFTGPLWAFTGIFDTLGATVSWVFLKSSREVWAFNFFLFFLSLPEWAGTVLKPSSLGLTVVVSHRVNIVGPEALGLILTLSCVTIRR